MNAKKKALNRSNLRGLIVIGISGMISVSRSLTKLNSYFNGYRKQKEQSEVKIVQEMLPLVRG